MSTPTPRTNAAWASSFEPCEYRAAHTARTMRECSQQLETELTTLTAERDHWQKIAVSASYEREHNANVAQAMTAERDQLRAERDSIKQEIELVEHRVYRAEVERDQLRTENATFRAAQKACEACDEPTAFEVRQLRAQLHALQLVCGTTDADKFSTWVDRANARAERAEAELATAKERLRSEAMDDYAAIKDLQRELAIERARLDWLLQDNVMRFDTSYHDRAAIDAGMKEGA